MINDYNDYLKDNLGIIKFIYDNDLINELEAGIVEANNIVNREGKQFRHSYYFSKIYDILNNNNLDKLKTSSIVNLVENSFNKTIRELVDDYKLYLNEVQL